MADWYISIRSRVPYIFDLVHCFYKLSSADLSRYVVVFGLGEIDSGSYDEDEPDFNVQESKKMI